MKVLMINSGSRQNGNTGRALKVFKDALLQEGIQSEEIFIGTNPVADCMGCNQCTRLGNCVFNDVAVEIREKAKEADGFVFASPVYFVHPTGRILSVLHRSFYSDAMNGNVAFSDKPAVSLAVIQNAGQFAALDILNKFITIPNMQMAASTYWQNSMNPRTGEIGEEYQSVMRIQSAAQRLAQVIRFRESMKEGNLK